MLFNFFLYRFIAFFKYIESLMAILWLNPRADIAKSFTLCGFIDLKFLSVPIKTKKKPGLYPTIKYSNNRVMDNLG